MPNNCKSIASSVNKFIMARYRKFNVGDALRKANAEVVGEGKFVLPKNAPFNADGVDTPYAMRTWERFLWK